MWKAKNAYISHINIMSSSDPKSYQKLYEVITKKESSFPTLHLPESEALVSNSLEKANILNNQFLQKF